MFLETVLFAKPRVRLAGLVVLRYPALAYLLVNVKVMIYLCHSVQATAKTINSFNAAVANQSPVSPLE